MKEFIAAIKDFISLGDTDKRGWYGDAVLKRIFRTLKIGLLGITIFAATFSKLVFLTVISTGFLLAGASSICGSFLGFLFGIPRTNQVDGYSTTETDSGDKNIKRVSYNPNTNLEQISDWLTKILVGVGLTQIGDISAGFNKIISFYSPYMEGNSAVVSAIIIYFSICGFMLGFLWSRLYMAGAIMNAEEEGIEERIARKLQNKVDQQAQYDAKALTVVNQVLNPDPNSDPINQDDLNTIIAKASPAIKVAIFNQAQDLRQQYWKNQVERPKTSNVIPIFRALISFDPEGKYHKNHGQLGYALKDKINPDYVSAEQELTKAINIRDKAGKKLKSLFYEFNRAYCRIKINELQGTDVFSKDDILQDIEVAKQSPEIKNIILNDEVVGKWLQNNI